MSNSQNYSKIYVNFPQGDIRAFLKELYPSQSKLRHELEYNKERRDYDVLVKLDGEFITNVNDMIEVDVPADREWQDVWDETLLAEKRRIFDELKAVI